MQTVNFGNKRDQLQKANRLHICLQLLKLDRSGLGQRCNYLNASPADGIFLLTFMNSFQLDYAVPGTPHDRVTGFHDNKIEP
jgi:hypothetical protein